MKDPRVEIFKKYKYDIHPRISDYRGTNFIKRQLGRIASTAFESAPKESETRISERSWENLIILDACRYDHYQRLNGNVEKIFTPSSHSRAFIEENFSEGDWTDTVVVTANPHYDDSKFEKATGRDIEKTFCEVFKTYESGWDKDLGAIPAENIIEEAKTAAKLFPEKKLIIHFMQPHGPFIGALGRYEGTLDMENDAELVKSGLALADREKISKEQMEEIYRLNLEYVQPHVEKLVDELEGETVITADHGELLGEKGLFGHIYAINAKELREVPWDVRK